MPPARPRPAAHRRGAGSAGRARPCGNVQTAWSASWARFWIRVRIWRRRPADASLFGLVAALFFAAVAVLVVYGRLDVAATGSHAPLARRPIGIASCRERMWQYV